VDGEFPRLYIMGYTSKDDNIFRNDMILGDTVAGFLDGLISLFPQQYIINVTSLKQTLQEIKIPKDKPKVFEYGFNFPLYIAKSKAEISEDTLNFFMDITNSGGTVEIVSRKLSLYKTIIDAQKIPDSSNAYRLLLMNAKAYNIGSLNLQRYGLLLLCLVSSYNHSFSQFFIHCETAIAELLCSNNIHKCGQDCEIKSHTGILEYMIKSFKDNASFIETNTFAMTAKNVIQKRISEHFGDISTIYERINTERYVSIDTNKLLITL
jgi:hypothetical protein